jgi:rieske iron-sulfur protein
VPASPHRLGGAVERRRALQLIAAGAALTVGDRIRAQPPEPGVAAPQAGDRLVFAAGDRTGQTISLADLIVGGPPIMAFAAEPTGQVIRNASRLNQLLVVRFDPGDLTDETRARAADGVVAYSAVCTHTGCDVTEWRQSERHFRCLCHDSEFDPRDAAEVRTGPAPRRLPALPLKVEQGRLVVAEGFTGRVGPSPSQNL